MHILLLAHFAGSPYHGMVFGSPQDIAEKIKQVYEVYERISANAFEASKGFSWDKVANELIKIYNL